MNLFLVGGDAGRAADVLESLRAPFLADGVLTRLADGACLSHPGMDYCAVDGGRYALFAGRPIRWEGEEADGRGPLDPALYLDGVPDGLDGRFAVVRTGGEVVTDPLGAYPVYRRGSWISNSPAALIAAVGPSELSPDALAGVLGGGWSLSGDPLWAGISRVPWSGAGLRAAGKGFDPQRAARLLVSAVRALADWPGRPNVVLVTGGRDSRLILAAAIAAGIEFSAQTGGTDDMPDVVIGRQLAAAAGVEHRMLDPHPHGDFQAHWQAMARSLAATTGGTATLADAAGFPLSPLSGPLPLWHTGQGGEIARGYYAGATSEGDLLRRFLAERPGRASVLSAAGRERVAQQIDHWAGSLDAPAEDLGDLFYLHQRMARWAAPTHAAVEPIRDSTSALWSWRLLPDLLGLPARTRAREEFHRRVLEVLAPDLAAVPYEHHPTFAQKLRAELRRRLPRRGVPHVVRDYPAERMAPPPDPFATALAEVRELVLADTEHPAWEVLDRGRVKRLLSAEPSALDAMSRQYVWRLATVYAGFPAGPAAQ